MGRYTPLAQARLPLPFFTFVREIAISEEHVLVVVPPYGVVGSVLEQLAAVLRSVVRSVVITPTP